MVYILLIYMKDVLMSDLPFGNIFGEESDVAASQPMPLQSFPTGNNVKPSMPQSPLNSFGGGNINMLEGFGGKNVNPIQGFGTSQSLDVADEIDKDEEFKVEAVFKDFTPIGIGTIKRIVPIGEWLLDDPSVKALKRNLDEMGITKVMPQVYANRVKHNIEQGYVQPDGKGFTEKGQQRAAEYLQYRYNKTSEQAMERVATAKSMKIDNKRADKAKGLDLKFGFGYQLDTSGRTIRS